VSHDVVLTGFRLNAGEPPAKVLERVLGLEPAKARAATQRFPVILARTSQERADQLADLLREAGAMVDVREVGAVARPTQPMPAPAPGAPSLPPIPGTVSPRTSAPALGLPGTASPVALAPTQPALRPVATMPTVAGLPPLPMSKGGNAPAPLPAFASLPAPGAAAPRPEAPSAAPHALGAALAAPQALTDAQPENDWNMQALAPVLPPVGESLADLEPAAPPHGMSAYQLGDLAIDLGKKPAAGAASTPSSLPPAGSAPAPARAAELELDTQAAPAPARAPAAAVSAPEAPAFGGMASFGDGFDDMNKQDEPALELDRDASWLRNQKAEAKKDKPKAAAPAAAPAEEYSEAPLRERRPPPKIVAPAPLTTKQRIQYALLEALETAKVVSLHALAILAMSVVTGLAVAYGRSPDALFELVGLSPPPAVSTELRVPVVPALAIPPLLHEARIHPLLRLAPEQLAPEVAKGLRARVPGWHRIEVKWPRPEDVQGHHLECLLVEHARDDKKGVEAAGRVHALLRTGQALELPPEVQKRLRDEMLTRRDEQGLKKRFTQLCLAL
jgi:hypothetical protein